MGESVDFFCLAHGPQQEKSYRVWSALSFQIHRIIFEKKTNPEYQQKHPTLWSMVKGVGMRLLCCLFSMHSRWVHSHMMASVYNLKLKIGWGMQHEQNLKHKCVKNYIFQHNQILICSFQGQWQFFSAIDLECLIHLFIKKMIIEILCCVVKK